MQSVTPRVYSNLPEADYTIIPAVNEAVKESKDGYITARNLGSINDSPNILFDIGESATTLLDIRRTEY